MYFVVLSLCKRMESGVGRDPAALGCSLDLWPPWVITANAVWLPKWCRCCRFLLICELFAHNFCVRDNFFKWILTQQFKPRGEWFQPHSPVSHCAATDKVSGQQADFQRSWNILYYYYIIYVWNWILWPILVPVILILLLFHTILFNTSWSAALLGWLSVLCTWERVFMSRDSGVVW